MEGEHTSQTRTSTTANERCHVVQSVTKRASHLIHFRNTLLHNHNVWKSLQVPNPMRYAHGKLRADIICALKIVYWGRVRSGKTDLYETFFTHKPSIEDLDLHNCSQVAQFLARIMYQLS